MLVSIVNTLTEFESIDRVTVKVNGKSGKLANGTELPEGLSRLPLNISETVEASALGDTKPVTLFFANESCSLNIPITRYMSEPTFESKVLLSRGYGADKCGNIEQYRNGKSQLGF